MVFVFPEEKSQRGMWYIFQNAKIATKSPVNKMVPCSCQEKVNRNLV